MASRELTLQLDHAGYVAVSLRAKESVYKTFKVHRLVCSMFNRDIHSSERIKVNHVNKITDDNRSCNLEWVSRSENMTHAIGTPTIVKVMIIGEVLAVVPAMAHVIKTYHIKDLNKKQLFRRLKGGKAFRASGEVDGREEELFIQIASAFYEDQDYRESYSDSDSDGDSKELEEDKAIREHMSNLYVS
ncbi:hypothetical protein K492DRAFT_209837 [Lichtheimia hyalospora FSU 10163]|nr:hypothetical protein K492DRAFT_209837 [Lichtheimia hyalospora FSU 10163]